MSQELDLIRKAQTDASKAKGALNRQSPQLQTDKTLLEVKVVSLLGVLDNGDNVYECRVTNPYDTTISTGTIVSPVIARNEYKYFLGDVALTAIGTAGVRQFISGGSFDINGNGYGIYVSSP